MKNILMVIGFVLTSLACRNPAPPIHTAFSHGATLTSNCERSMGLHLSTSTDTSITPIEALPLAKLTLSDFTATGANPLPPLPITFLAIQATVNDTMGGYAQFTIQGSNSSAKPITIPSLSGVVQWIPKLEAGKYQVTAIPCNSLGCREDLKQSLSYEQIANDFTKYKEVITSFNQCFDTYRKLQAAGANFHSHIASIADYFARLSTQQGTSTGLNLDESTGGCVHNAYDTAETSMNNIEKMGKPYLASVFSNPDMIQIQAENYGNKSAATSTDTDTESAEKKGGVSKETMQIVILGLGAAAIIGGFMVFINQSIKTTGWTDFTSNRRVEANNLAQALIESNLNPADAKTKLASIKNLPTSLKSQVEAKLDDTKTRYPDDANKKTFTYSPDNYNNKVKSFKSAAIEAGVGFFIGMGGVIATVAGARMELASNPFDDSANYINNTILPLQEQFANCTVNLSQIIQGTPAP